MPEGIPTIQPAKTVEYTTPKDLFDKLSAEVDGFDMDPFCRPYHYTAQRVLGNGGTICIPSASAYTTDAWLSALPYADKSRVLVDGLAQPWHGKVWLQPPYGLFLRKAIPYAVREVERGNVEFVMALLPAKTEVQWWQKYVMSGVTFDEGHAMGVAWVPAGWRVSSRSSVLNAVRFVPGRLSFGGSDGGPARVGNVIVVWRK